MTDREPKQGETQLVNRRDRDFAQLLPNDNSSPFRQSGRETIAVMQDGGAGPNEIQQIGCRNRQVRRRPKSIFVERVSTSLPSKRLARRPQKPAQNLERLQK